MSILPSVAWRRFFSPLRGGAFRAQLVVFHQLAYSNIPAVIVDVGSAHGRLSSNHPALRLLSFLKQSDHFRLYSGFGSPVMSLRHGARQNPLEDIYLQWLLY
jgi:hypothetical protein